MISTIVTKMSRMQEGCLNEVAENAIRKCERCMQKYSERMMYRIVTSIGDDKYDWVAADFHRATLLNP